MICASHVAVFLITSSDLQGHLLQTFETAVSCSIIQHLSIAVADAVLPLSRQKKCMTFPDEIAENILNKSTFSNTKSACYKVLVAFQQLTKVNSKCWTLDKNKVQVSYMMLCTHVLAHHRHYASSSVNKSLCFADFCDYTNCLTFVLFLWQFQVSRNLRKVVTLQMMTVAQSAVIRHRINLFIWHMSSCSHFAATEPPSCGYFYASYSAQWFSDFRGASVADARSVAKFLVSSVKCTLRCTV